MHSASMYVRIVIICAAAACCAQTPDTYLPWEGGPEYYSKWSGGLPAEQSFFPVSVWLQDPNRAWQYKDMEVNLFIGLWKGPTAAQLATLADAGMPVLATYNGEMSDRSILRGWTLMDEPDNAQSDGAGGYGSCVLPPAIVEQYEQIKAADATRPVLLNLGQGVINDTYKGRGSACARHSEHYPEYIKGADIVSFDVYPVNSEYPLWWVGGGIDRLREWAEYRKPAWTWIETTSIRGGPKPTPYQIRAEVWMAIIHGARGIGYFCHRFSPTFSETGPLDDAEIREALKALNGQIASLAPVLNTRPVGNGVTVSGKVDTLLKRYDGATYLFAVGAPAGRGRGCGIHAAGLRRPGGYRGGRGSHHPGGRGRFYRSFRGVSGTYIPVALCARRVALTW